MLAVLSKCFYTHVFLMSFPLRSLPTSPKRERPAHRSATWRILGLPRAFSHQSPSQINGSESLWQRKANRCPRAWSYPSPGERSWAHLLPWEPAG